MDKKKFAGYMARLAELFPNHTPTESVMDAYWKEFADYDDADFVEACKKIKSTRFSSTFPRIADFRAYLTDDPDARGTAQWMGVLDHIRKKGSDTPLDEGFDEETMAAVRFMGGLRSLGQRNEQELVVWGAKSFLHQYALAAKHSGLLIGYDKKPAGQIGEQVKMLADGMEV